MTSGRIGIARSARAVVWASAQQLAVDQVVTKIGSGLNGRRPKLARLLTNAQVTTIVVQHRDRLARFGSSTSRPRAPPQGRRIVVADDSKTTDDLVGDMVEC